MKYFPNIILCVLSFMILSCSTNRKIENGDYYENIDGLNLEYTIKGSGPVMLVGHPSSGKIGYELTLKPLEDRFTMVYYNSRGIGKSEIPNSLQDYTLANYSKELDLLRKKLGVEKIWLFGHSDQSAVALQYAVEHPDNILGLILTGTSFIGTIDETFQRRKNAENERILQSEWFRQVVKDWDYIYDHNTTIDDNNRDLSDAPLKWWTYDEETFQKVKPIAQKINEIGRRKPIDGQNYNETPEQRQKYLDVQKKFRNLKVKILIINGKFDTNNTPEFVEILQKNLPNSELILIDKAGHFPWVEQPEKTFSEINKWLIK